MKRVQLLMLNVLVLGVFIQGVHAAPGKTSSPTQKAVLVTGASSGIGRHIAVKLASEGYFVYAGARKAEDLKELSAITNIEGIRLDVTRQDEIDEAVALVRKRGKGLYGLVNNAGVGVVGPLIEFDEAEMLKGPEDRSNFEEPTAVAEAVVHAMSDPKPKRRYLVVPVEGQARATICAAIRRAVELNQDQPYSYDRAALIKMLDEAMAAAVR